MTQNTNQYSQSANTDDEQTDVINDRYLPLLYDLAAKQNNEGLSQIQQEIGRDTLVGAMDAAYGVYVSQLYDLCPNLIIDQRRDEDDEANHVVEIFMTIYAEPFDHELDILRDQTKPLFKAMRWILENRVKQKLPISTNALKQVFIRYFADTKTYAQVLIKGDLARNMLNTLTVPDVSDDDKKQLYEDARVIFGISAKSTDFSQEEHMIRVSTTLLNITTASDITFSARELLKKSYDDEVNIEDILQVAQIILPEIMAQKDDTLAYLVFPDESKPIDTKTGTSELDVG